MNHLILFPGKNKKNISKCHPLKFLPVILQDLPYHFPVEGTSSKVPWCDEGANFHLCLFELFP